MSFAEKYFAEAYRLAELGRGKTSPNPFVGAVIVTDNKIVGRGYTQPYGGNHAEVQALNEAGPLAKDADLYVTLEPCAHYGKTPPCTEAIIKAGLKRVFAGLRDPNPLVSGKGFAQLREAGIEVVEGIWEDKIEIQLEAFIFFITKKRPFIIMKNAVTLDGKIADQYHNSKWISNDLSRIKAHELRKETDIVITGINTVLEDDPLLNVRLSEHDNKKNHRLILDSQLKIPENAKIVLTAKENYTIICKDENYHNPEKEIYLSEMGIQIVDLPAVNGKLALPVLMNFLYSRKYCSALLEAGPNMCSSFLEEKLVDQIYYFVAPKILGLGMDVFGQLKTKSLTNCINLTNLEYELVGDNVLIMGYPNYV